jgi:cobalt-zinc-cadmium efflux system outer membrane protein
MDAKLGAWKWRPSIALGALVLLTSVPVATQAPAQTPPQAPTQSPPLRVTLDQVIAMALQHNHALQAARTTILQNQSQEVTANLRPNPVLLGDAQFLPFFQPGESTVDYLANSAQFDLGVSYLFERGMKRQHRLEAAKAQTAVTTSQVADNERTLTFNVASQFIAAVLAQADLDFAEQGLASFQQTVTLSEASHDAGAMSDGDLLKIKLQLLQFQMDVSAARLARVQALASLRQLAGYESLPENYQVVGDLQYQPLPQSEDDLKTMALRQRPDLRAAQLGVASAQSQLSLAQANGKKDVNAQINYTHVAALSSASLFASIQLPIFDRNQGEIARTRQVITQSQELSSEQASLVLTDVTNAYEAVRADDQVVQLYQSGYLKQAQDSLDISQYGYQRGASTLLDFLDAQRSYRAIELAYRQSLATYMVALEQLRQAVATRSLP